ncbi:MAG: protoporphyrinogen oxidase [Candidatus Acidiferrales bacterium]
MPPQIQVAVIGAGISGLSCAHRLRQLGISALVLESQEHGGGLVGTVERDSFRFESGPQSFLCTKPILELIRAVNIEPELLHSDPRAPRYIYKNKRLHAIPMSPPAVLASSLLSLGSRYRIISEPFRRTMPQSREESVADFVRRKFGHEILEYLVAPFVSGVYAGDPEILSLKSAFPSLDEWEREHGSVIRGAMNARKAAPGPRPSLCSFRGGMKTLPEALARSLDSAFVPGVRTDSIERNVTDSGLTIRFMRGGQREELKVQAVVVATPAYVSGHIIEGLSPNLAKSLLGIPYAPVAVVAHGYKRRQVANSLIGFGVLIPRKEGLRTLGTVWNSSLFPGCTPSGSVLITSFVGGATDTEIVHADPDEISTTVEEEISGILEISGVPVAKQVWRYERGLPQYNLGHAHILENISAELANLPGLFLTGNYWIGPALGNCVEAGARAAESAQSYLSGKTSSTDAQSSIPAVS